MNLYYMETPNARKACAVARYLDLAVKPVRINLAAGEHKKPEFLKINPNGKVPVLQDGDVTVWESSAIMMHLAQRAESDLWPNDAAAQVDVHKWLSWDSAHFSRHAGTLLFENYLKPAFSIGVPDAATVAEAEGFFNQFAQVLDNHLKGRSFVSGDRLSIADFALTSVLPSAKDAKLSLQSFEEIRRWFGDLMKIPAIESPWPEHA